MAKSKKNINFKTIVVKIKTKERLDSNKIISDESYDSVISRGLDKLEK